MNSETKAKIRNCMMAHARTLGYPNHNHDKIIAELPNFWKKLEAAGLLEDFKKKGLTFKGFVDIAIKKKREAEMFAKFNVDFSNIFRRRR